MWIRVVNVLVPRPMCGPARRPAGGHEPVTRVQQLPPTLTVNGRFLAEFISAVAPCFARGLVEQRRFWSGLLAIQLAENVPLEVLGVGCQLRCAVVGPPEYDLMKFSFGFQGLAPYHALVNPNNAVVRTVLRTMVDRGEHCVYVRTPNGAGVAFPAEAGERDVTGFADFLPRLLGSTTSEAQYRRTLQASRRNPSRRGTWLEWVCRNCWSALDVVNDRFTLT